MKVGTSVVDVRNHRSIGYWTGAELSENLPPRALPVSQPGASSAPEDKVTLEEMLSVFDNTDPASIAAFDAASWILLNTPDGPAVERAAALISEEHARRPDLETICVQIDRVRHRSAPELLETILRQNPHPEVLLTASFTLATLRKDACKHGLDTKLTAEAEVLFERVIKEFNQARRGLDRLKHLATKAQAELSELRRLTIGKPAPDFQGATLQGERIKLSEHRGKVVAVVFWTTSTVDGPEEHRKLFELFADRPFAWLGINCDTSLAQARTAVEQHRITWPVIWDGRSGPISRDWNVNGWPAVFVIDRQGVIRSRDSRGPELREAVAALLQE
jgi:peroxiredoxin